MWGGGGVMRGSRGFKLIPLIYSPVFYFVVKGFYSAALCLRSPPPPLSDYRLQVNVSSAAHKRYDTIKQPVSFICFMDDLCAPQRPPHGAPSDPMRPNRDRLNAVSRHGLQSVRSTWARPHYMWSEETEPLSSSWRRSCDEPAPPASQSLTESICL